MKTENEPKMATMNNPNDPIIVKGSYVQRKLDAVGVKNCVLNKGE